MDLQSATSEILRPMKRDLLHEILEGLSRPQKMLSSKFLYDDRGSQLFSRICELDEYYPTRTELEIMRTGIEEMSALIGSRTRLIELGSGSGLKSKLLLGFLDQLAAYIPVDISVAEMRRCIQALQPSFSHLNILPVYADYTKTWSLPVCCNAYERSVIYYPGSTLGNFTPAAAEDFMSKMHHICGPGGAMIVGIDLKKDIAVLEAAYNDASGVTAAFNLNILARLNRELDADFYLEDFTHRAFYDEEFGRIEMHLISRRDQSAHIGHNTFEFTKGESILTEYSYKYSLDEFASLANRAGFEPSRVWTDDNELFSVWYLEA